MEGTSAQEVSLLTRFQVWFESIPFYTRGFLVGVVSIYALGLLTGWPHTGLVCLSASAVVQSLQVYRIFTAVLFHVGLLHVAFNMLAFVPIGQDLERSMGTIQFSYLNLLLTVFEALIYSTTTYLLNITGLLQGQCAVGASGVIFGLIVVDNSLSPGSVRSMFGLFTVPTKWYPWALLVLWQLLMPDISFIGHLSGILVGEAYSRGWLDWLKLSVGVVTKLEDSWPVAAYCVPHSGFIMRPGLSLPVSHSSMSYQSSTAQRAAGPQLLGNLHHLVQRAQAWFRNTPGGPPPGAQPTGRAGQTRGVLGGQSGGYSGVPTADADEGWTAASSSSASAEGSSNFRGSGHQLGGSKHAESLVVNPRAAAAAAAEARLGVGPAAATYSRADVASKHEQ